MLSQLLGTGTACRHRDCRACFACAPATPHACLLLSHDITVQWLSQLAGIGTAEPASHVHLPLHMHVCCCHTTSLCSGSPSLRAQDCQACRAQGPRIRARRCIPCGPLPMESVSRIQAEVFRWDQRNSNSLCVYPWRHQRGVLCCMLQFIVCACCNPLCV